MFIRPCSFGARLAVSIVLACVSALILASNANAQSPGLRIHQITPAEGAPEDDPPGLPTPHITELSPTQGMAGDTITIKGENFCPDTSPYAENEVYWEQSWLPGSGFRVIPFRESETEISFVVPGPEEKGTVSIGVRPQCDERPLSNLVSFKEILAPPPPQPRITQVLPARGEAGDTITIRGEHFCPDTSSKADNVVLITAANGHADYARIEPVSESENEVSFIVPDGVPVGQVLLQLRPNFRCDDNFHLTHSFEVLGEVPPPEVDTTPPPLELVKKPGKKVRKAKVKFVAQSESNAKLECKLDRKPWKPCNAGYATKGMGKAIYRVKHGNHTFKVRATDAAGNQTLMTAKFKRVKKGKHAHKGTQAKHGKHKKQRRR